MDRVICKECKEEYDCSLEKCPNCGCPTEINQKHAEMISKKRKRSIIGLSITGVTVVGTLIFVLFFSVIPILKSNKNYKKAESLYNDKDYVAAISCYEKVIEKDKENYDNAQKQIALISGLLEKNRFVSKAVSALIVNGYCSSLNDVDSLKAGEGMVTCRIKGIGYTASINKKTPVEHEGLGTYSNVRYDDIFQLFLVEYKASFMENGWLTFTTNEIRQEGADANFQIDEVFTKPDGIDREIVAYYVDKYNQTKDVSIFD